MAKEKFNKKLLVEGNDDRHVIWALCEKFQVAETFDVVDCEGVTNLISQIPVRLKQSGVNTIGIIIDADTNLLNRWETLRTILGNHGFVLSSEVPENGFIVETSGFKIGVWIMPNNLLNGMLEDFISFLVPKEDLLIQAASNVLLEIENKGLNKYSAVHKSKALIHTWLSWQEDPGTPLGLAITKRYLTTDEETCSKLIQWLIAIFA